MLFFTFLKPFILNFNHLLAGFASSILVQQDSARNKTKLLKISFLDVVEIKEIINMLQTMAIAVRCCNNIFMVSLT